MYQLELERDSMKWPFSEVTARMAAHTPLKRLICTYDTSRTYNVSPTSVARSASAMIQHRIAAFKVKNWVLPKCACKFLFLTWVFDLVFPLRFRSVLLYSKMSAFVLQAADYGPGCVYNRYSTGGFSLEFYLANWAIPNKLTFPFPKWLTCSPFSN